MTSHPVHRSILALDIESSTAPLRTNPIKKELRDLLYGFLIQAMEYAGVGEERHDPFDDRGDGILLPIHPVDDVPKTFLLSRLVPELTRQLTDYNLGLASVERMRRELRVRAAIHAGDILCDETGCIGEAVDVACRMLDSPKLKAVLRSVPTPMVLAVSSEIYWGIVRHEYVGIDASDYRPHYSVLVCGRRQQVFVHVPSPLVLAS
ncbi:hypothetical protein AB0C21_32435 [Spirillospora sp. NPDC049024]